MKGLGLVVYVGDDRKDDPMRCDCRVLNGFYDV